MTSWFCPSARCMLVRSQVVGCSLPRRLANRGLRGSLGSDTELAAPGACTRCGIAQQSGLPAPGGSVVSVADSRSQHMRHRRCSRCHMLQFQCRCGGT